MAEIRGFLGRDHLPQLTLRLQGVLGPVRQAQAPSDADAVGVAYVGLLTEHVAQDQIGCLSAHAGKSRQLFHGAGHLAAVLRKQLLGAGHDVPGLAVIKAAGVDVLAHLCRVSLGKALQGREAGIKSRGHLIDPLVRALGGQADGKQQLVVFFVLQRAKRIRISLLELVNDPLDCGLGFHGDHLLSDSIAYLPAKGQGKNHGNLSGSVI